jgi:beta-1,4-mannosyltransferase
MELCGCLLNLFLREFFTYFDGYENMKTKTICFYPSIKKGSNHFLFNLSKFLESTGKFRCVGYKEVKKEFSRRLLDADIYHMNWFDQSKSVFSFFSRLLFLILLKLKKRKIVWTIHNVQPHIKVPVYNRFLFHFLARFSNVIHIMSKDSVSIAGVKKYANKVKWIPHGDYYGSYPSSDFDVRNHYEIGPCNSIFLFLGAIKPYKNIEVLVEAFQKNWNSKILEEDSPVLLICGKVETLEYGCTIRRLLEKSKNVILDAEFVPDEHLAAYLKSATVLVAPYSYQSSLNSGTLPLAFSYGKTLICPDIPCVKDVDAETDCLYSYHYENEEDHIKILSQKMEQAYLDFRSGKIVEKERNAKIYMEKNSWNAHMNDWVSLYEESLC